MLRTCAIAAGLLILIPQLSLACSCVGTQDIDQAVRVSRFAFAAHVDSMVYARSKPGGLRICYYYMRVLAVWKGDVPEFVQLKGCVSNCDFGFQPGRRYLVFQHDWKSPTPHVPMICSATRPLRRAQVGRYLLGEPATRYDDRFETMTLDMLVNLIRDDVPGATDVARQFEPLSPDTPLLLPALLPTARGDAPGNRLAAVRAIGYLGSPALGAYDDLRGILFDTTADRDSGLRAEALRSMLRLTREYPVVREDIQRALVDNDANVRAVAAEVLLSLSNRADYQLEIRRSVERAMEDPDPLVRAAVIDGIDYWSLSPRTARLVETCRYDPHPEVRMLAVGYLRMREEAYTRGSRSRSAYERGFHVPGMLRRR